MKYQDSKQDGRHNKDEYPKFRLEFEPLYQRRPSSQLPFIQPKLDVPTMSWTNGRRSLST